MQTVTAIGWLALVAACFAPQILRTTSRWHAERLAGRCAKHQPPRRRRECHTARHGDCLCTVVRHDGQTWVWRSTSDDLPLLIACMMDAERDGTGWDSLDTNVATDGMYDATRRIADAKCSGR